MGAAAGVAALVALTLQLLQSAAGESAAATA
eukprot:COSAG06_NODE_43317_length_373_cov_0.737226_2_plen_30_part_01